MWVNGSPVSESPPELAEHVRMSKAHNRTSASEPSELWNLHVLQAPEEIHGLLNFGKHIINTSSSFGHVETWTHLYSSVPRY